MLALLRFLAILLGIGIKHGTSRCAVIVHISQVGYHTASLVGIGRRWVAQKEDIPLFMALLLLLLLLKLIVRGWEEEGWCVGMQQRELFL
jgi:hypothetical protein